jgi:hypothetical protein
MVVHIQGSRLSEFSECDRLFVKISDGGAMSIGGSPADRSSGFGMPPPDPSPIQAAANDRDGVAIE